MLDRALVRSMRADGSGVREIARLLGVSRNAVRRALDPAAAERYRRASRLERLADDVRAVLTEYPFMPATRVAVHVGWTGSTRHLSDLVRQIRAELVDPMAPASITFGCLEIGTCSAGIAAAARIEMGRTTWRRSLT